MSLNSQLTLFFSQNSDAQAQQSVNNTSLSVSVAVGVSDNRRTVGHWLFTQRFSGDPLVVKQSSRRTACCSFSAHSPIYLLFPSFDYLVIICELV